VSLLLEDEFGDDVHVDFHPDQTVEMAATDSVTGLYKGGMVLNKENVKRLVRRLVKFINGDPDADPAESD
jgi:hypothetical protein